MKHTVTVTLILITIFFFTQFLGLFTVNRYIDVQTDENGTVSIIHEETLIGPQPDIPQDEKSYTFVMITIMVLIGTALLFVLIKFNLGKVWKLWFLFAITITLSVSFDVYIARWAAFSLALVLGLIRLFKPNPWVHNFTELFIYPGITILILPLLNLFSATLLLVAISIYDMIAVWKSKHMIKLAKFQLESKSFAGISMNYNVPKEGKKKGSSEKGGSSNAILGGGDIAFPLLFSAAVMEHLILNVGIPKLQALFMTFSITVGAGIGLSLLLFYSKKDRFYPAMPFISAGCFLGYTIILLLL